LSSNSKVLPAIHLANIPEFSPVALSVTSQDFIKFWGNFFAFVLLEMTGNSQEFETFEFI
jgi:hypothetical protein